MIEDKFDRLTSYFEEINDSLNNGSEYLYSPVLKSDWIYVKENRSDYAEKAEFEKSIKLNSVPDTAYIQLMGDTYARLYINGKFVNEVLAKRSGSLLVDYKRVKFLNVKRYLQKGVNNFLVKAENYNEHGSAGFNISSYFKSAGSVLNIDTHPGDWKGRPEGETNWKETEAKDYPWLVIAPNFITKRPSWIER